MLNEYELLINTLSVIIFKYLYLRFLEILTLFTQLYFFSQNQLIRKYRLLRIY